MTRTHQDRRPPTFLLTDDDQEKIKREMWSLVEQNKAMQAMSLAFRKWLRAAFFPEPDQRRDQAARLMAFEYVGAQFAKLDT